MLEDMNSKLLNLIKSCQALQIESESVRNVYLWNNNCQVDSLTELLLSAHLTFVLTFVLLQHPDNPDTKITIDESRFSRIIYRMVIVEGCCTMARLSSLGANCSLVDTKE